ncbi:MAG: YdbH domain-containing protein [Novosphingobium sp.]|nr:YdbH domain-containing protein [Novosphingobium sp.]
MAENDSLGAPLEQVLESAPPDETPPERERRYGRLAKALAIFALVVALAFAIVWTQRELIANNVIGNELESRGIPATYRVERIGARRQVLADIVVGDPARPDLTVRRAEVRLNYRLGFPTIGRITLVEPRLFGTYRGGKLSFGSLDPLIFRDTGKAFELPRLDMRIRDGRALLETDYGPLGFKAEGEGRLDDGFEGMVAVAAPRLAGFGCQAERASYYGAIRIRDERPALTGPLRIGSLSCPGRALALENASVRIASTFDQDIRGAEGRARLAGGRLAWGGYRAAAFDLANRFTYRDDALTLRVDGSLAGVATPQLGLGRLATEGTLRARDDFARVEFQGSLDGTGVRLGTGLDRALAGAQAGTQGTLLAPLLARFRGAIAREARGGRLLAELDVRKTGALTTVVVPQASLSGGSGETLAALSRFSLTSGGGGAPRLAGNFSTGGPGLPRIAGRMERLEDGRAVFRMAMAEYRVGSSSLALPRLALAQADDGSLGFAGEARASGPLPGGFAQGLVVPVDGNLAADGALALFRRCTALRFDRLTLASLTLERRGLTLCPQRGRPIVRYAGGALSIAAGAPSLDLAGRLGQTPVRIASGPIGFAHPGVLTARRLDVALGPTATASRFRVSNLEARIGNEIAGTFEDADVRLFATPLDLVEADGRWRYANDRLSITDADFRLLDRRDPPRFAPLVAQDAAMTLFANEIDAKALLRHAASGRDVALATIHHDLARARGYADLAVTGLRFDPAFQPADISRLALGTIANARGTVTGTGRIDWTPGGVTSRGRFSTENLDFAAAFGPVTGMSGTVEFTDLLGLVTAPDQEVRVASLNPGIEVTEGVIRFELNGSRLMLKGASWPFLGGRLSLAPTTLNLGVSEARKYTLLIEGLDAARFVERMGFANLQARGIFDGELPLVFSAANASDQVAAAVGTILGIGTEQAVAAAQSTPGSGRIENGQLRSRPPGGNVSYIGELTYRDLSPMANFAFQTLRSLDYRTMDITLNGSLEGEIVTQVRFDGVRQGPGAKRNILTRAVADLPIRMNVNIRAPFYQLITSFKALYDPAFVKDPRTLGLIDAQGRPIPRPAPSPNSQQPGIQPPESEKVP